DFAYRELDALTGGKLSLVNEWVSKGIQWTGEVASDALKSLNASETLASHGAAFTVGAVGSLTSKKVPSLRSASKSLKPQAVIGKRQARSVARMEARPITQPKPQKPAQLSKKTSAEPYEVGEYGELSKRSAKDGMDAHHAMQANPADQVIAGYNRSKAPAIVLPKEEHRRIPTQRGVYKGTARGLLAKDVMDIKKYTNAPNKQIMKLIDKNKETYPESLKKPPKE
ncbi:MAG: hypothetical protein ACRCUQ_01905, partial [Alphaproteobacteria bacterium]